MEEGITSIKGKTFEGLDNVISIILPNSLTKLENSALSGNKKLESITIPNKVVTLPQYVLSSCEELKSVTLPKGLKKIGESAFYSCYSLEKLTIPDSVTNIGKGAFDYTSLATLVLPKNLKSMKADLSKMDDLHKVVNHSKISIPLDNSEGRRVWKVNGKKVTKLAPGKTATTAGVKYKIKYYLSGGKVKGKLPKYYYYGVKTKLPKISKKGYTFLGWFQIKDAYNIEKFSKWSYDDITLTAMLVKIKVNRISKTKVKFSFSDRIRWRDLGTEDGKQQMYTVRVFENRPAKEFANEKLDFKLAKYGSTDKKGNVIISNLNPKKKYHYEVSFRLYDKDQYYYCDQGEYPGWYHYSTVPQFKKK